MAFSSRWFKIRLLNENYFKGSDIDTHFTLKTSPKQRIFASLIDYKERMGGVSSSSRCCLHKILKDINCFYFDCVKNSQYLELLLQKNDE